MSNLSKVSRIILCIIALSLLLSGCSGNPLIGIWTRTEMGMTISVEFKNNGTVQFSMAGITIEGKYEAKNGQLTIILDESLGSIGAIPSNSGPYSISGNILDIGGVTFTKSK